MTETIPLFFEELLKRTDAYAEPACAFNGEIIEADDV
jgi:hypothetical protein